MQNQKSKKLAEQIFTEYNEIANDFTLETFQSVAEVQQFIEENLTEDDINRLNDWESARMAFAGCLIGAMASSEMIVVVEGDGAGPGEGETTH